MALPIFSSEHRPGERIRHLWTEGAQPGLSILAGGMRITGELDVDGVLKIEGEVIGTIRAQDQVLVAGGGGVQGDISAGVVVVAGKVRGDINAEQRVELQPGADVEGDIKTPRVAVREGATLNGEIHTVKAAGLPRGAPSSASAARRAS